MKFYTVWCEWDIGISDVLFFSVDEAKEAAKVFLKNCDVEESVEELWEDLIGVTELDPYTKVEKFTLVSDDSGHNYVIPADKEAEWDEFVQDEEAMESGEEKPYANSVEGLFYFYFPET